MTDSELSSDDRVRAADFFDQCHQVVVDRLVRSHRSTDREVLHDAFIQALLEVAASPDKFDPERGSSICDFLYGAACQRLKTLMRSDQRRRRRDEEKGKELVAEKDLAARPIEDKVADAEAAERIRETIAQTEEERRVLQLWELGHKDAEIAERLNLELSHARRVRDRVVTRLGRLRPDDFNS